MTFKVKIPIEGGDTQYVKEIFRDVNGDIFNFTVGIYPRSEPLDEDVIQEIIKNFPTLEFTMEYSIEGE